MHTVLTENEFQQTIYMLTETLTGTLTGTLTETLLPPPFAGRPL